MYWPLCECAQCHVTKGCAIMIFWRTTLPWRHMNSMASTTPLFVKQLVYDVGNKSTKAPHYWCHFVMVIYRYMMTSPNGNIFRVTGSLCGEFTGEFPSQRPVTRSFDVFFDLHLNKRLNKQSRRRWFETPSLSLWRHRNETRITTSRREMRKT